MLMAHWEIFQVHPRICWLLSHQLTVGRRHQAITATQVQWYQGRKYCDNLIYDSILAVVHTWSQLRISWSAKRICFFFTLHLKVIYCGFFFCIEFYSALVVWRWHHPSFSYWLWLHKIDLMLLFIFMYSVILCVRFIFAVLSRSRVC